jgi:hypothetical protein
VRASSSVVSRQGRKGERQFMDRAAHDGGGGTFDTLDNLRLLAWPMPGVAAGRMFTVHQSDDTSTDL